MAKPGGKNQPVTIDGATLALLPTPRKIDLKTTDDVRLEMSRIYRDMRYGKIETGDGTKLVYVLGQIGKVIEAVEAEKRVAASIPMKNAKELTDVELMQIMQRL